MNKSILRYFRIAGCSLLALAVSACTRLGMSDTAGLRQEPRRSDPSPAGQAALGEDVRLAAETAALDRLQEQLDDANSGISGLRSSLRAMGPLPETDSFNIPVSEIYAEPPRLAAASSLFYHADMGMFESMAAARSQWDAASSKIRLDGLSPRFAEFAGGVSLEIGPLTSTASVDALCVELSSVAAQCGRGRQGLAVN